MILDPNSLTRLLLSGEAKRFPIAVHIGGTLPSTVHVLVTDSGNAFDPTITLTCYSEFQCEAVATTRPTLPLGPTSGQLAAKLCSDPACANQIASASLAYRFTVVIPGAQFALTRFAGVDEWSTEQGNAAHTGYMPVTLDPSKFSLRWKWTPPNLPTGFPNVLFWSGPPVSSSQKQMAYVAANVSDGTDSRLFALNEFDGTLNWQVIYPRLMYPGPPAVYGDMVYTTVINGNGPADSEFAAYDASNGGNVFISRFTTTCPQGCFPGAPTVVDGIAYVNPGSHGVVGGARSPVLAFLAPSGHLLWVANIGAAASQSVAVDASHAYIYAPNSNIQNGPGFTALNKVTGATVFGVPRTAAPVGSGQVYYQGDTPVLDGNGAAFFRLNRSLLNGGIQSISLGAPQILWETGGFGSVFAVADGALFYANAFSANSSLYAISTADAKPLWSAHLPPMFANTQTDRVLVTRNLIFVSTSEDVLAIDRTTRELVWAFPVGGQISLTASGLLYVVASNAVYAINLQ